MNKKRGVMLVLAVLFLLVLGLGKGAIDGCYYFPDSDFYCESGVSQEIAEEDCALNPDCDISQYFSSGTDCSDISDCEMIKCNVNCEDMTRGECEREYEEEKDVEGVDLGWEAVSEEEYNDWCSPGCCRTGSFCYYVGNKRECLRNAVVQGLDIDVWRTDIISQAECEEKVCGGEILPATLKVCVFDEAGNPLTVADNVKVEIGEIEYPVGNDGCTGELSLSVVGYIIRVSADGYLTDSRSISLISGEDKEEEFVLVQSIGNTLLEGTVKNSETLLGIPEATVSWRGPTEGFVLADEFGYYETPSSLVSNSEYTFTISKYGYSTKEETFVLVPGQEKNFFLMPIAFQGVKGTVWIDDDGDEIGDRPAIGASIYVNGVRKGYSQLDGNYEINLNMGDYEIYAAWEFYGMDPLTITIREDQATIQDLILTRHVGECSLGGDNPTKPVDVFSASHVLGEEKVKLEWTKPCPEVISYVITKNGEHFTTSSPADFFYIDSDVEWGETYTYTIVAVYDETRQSEPQTEATITLGEEECEGKYSAVLGDFEEFCLVEPEKRNKVWTCDETNHLVSIEDCGNLNNGDWFFCAKESETTAGCKDASKCKGIFQEADPFGLYYEKETCYGADNENYCYFDYTDTVADQCESCCDATGNCNINSCFDYKGQDACELNNCLGTDCQWIDAAQGLSTYLGFENILWSLINEETGHGYCVEADYDGNENDPEGDDYCGLCGSGAELFENYFCTAAVCSGLGRCFANPDLDSCESCGETGSCYDYQTEFGCTGEETQPLEVDDWGEVTLSQDKCGWGRCRWDGVPGGAGTCVKDGDADNSEDCGGLSESCRQDNQAPTTEVVAEGVKVISQADPILTFYAEDNNRLGVLGYCLERADANSPICSDFTMVSYEGGREEELEVDLTEELGEVLGATYRLRFYSVDEYSNRENVNEAFVFVDTKLPYFEINENTVTVADTTDLTVFLEGRDEPMSCVFELKPLLPSGETLTRTVSRDEEKEVLFEGLKGVRYEITVTCEDDYGNEYSDSDEYTFDLERRVNIIYPKGPVREMNIAFEVETLAGASCELYETATGNAIASFISDDNGKYHKTNPVPGFSNGDYAGTHYVVCTELLAQEVYNSDYFDFIVDFTRPETEIILKEGEREVTHVGDFEEEFFVGSVSVSFDCLAGDGFACDKTSYCLFSILAEEDYVPRSSPCYEEAIGEFTVDESTNICYYSVDAGGNEAYPACGKIVVDGYGITLVSPKEYYYLGEKWGVSNEPVFDWEIMTKVPTQECKFDFTEEFDYDTRPGYKVLSPGEVSNHYLFENFPGEIISPYSDNGGVKEVYVKCKNLEDEIGPSQKINLEYDPTAPEIVDAYAEPDLIVEGIETTLYVDTDDKTLCRYSDNSEGLGSSEYDLMEFSFPGEDTDDLKLEHEDIFSINFASPTGKKDYSLLTQCKNGAGNFSEAEDITFEVDYTVSGAILSLEPSGYLASTDVTLRVLTNKNAVCKYDENFFEITGGTEHTQALSGLSEGEHIYLVYCKIEEQEREGQIEFTVDLTAPVVTEVDDGNVSCSLSETPNVFVYTNEEAISGYYYELYDEGNNTFDSETLVKEGTVGAMIPFKVEFDLDEGHTYHFKVKASDAAGHWGTTLEKSDGFLAVPSSDVRCKENKAPRVNFIVEETCTKTTVEMRCDDETGCREFDYGKNPVSSLCDTADHYAGQQVLFEKTGWLCYYVEDGMGNKDEGIKKITFRDEDGDGIADSCDECPDTGAGEVADREGCASGQVSDEEKDKDTDNDGLPDYWEKLYDAVGCELDYLNDDSNLNSVYDADEDYDADDYNNYEEYMMGYDPCSPNAPPSEVEVKVTEGLPSAEKASVLAWVLFILGLSMVLGGSGYLIYYYQFRPKKGVLVRQKVPAVSRPAARPKSSWGERLLSLRKARTEKAKARERERIFGVFNKDSKKIPHVEEAIRKKGPHLRRLEELARRHAEVKKVVKPGLRSGEKGIFAKLESIAEKTKKKSIEDVVSKKEAKTIFDKLKEISKKRNAK